MYRDQVVRRAFRYLVYALALGVAAFVVLRPSIHPVAVVKNGVIVHIASWDGARIAKEKDDHDVIVHVHSLLPVGKLQLYVDDCLTAVRVNKVILKDKALPYCNWYDYMTLDVSDVMQVGSNTVTATLRNNLGGGRLVVTMSYASWLYRFMLAYVLACVAAFAFVCFRAVKKSASKTVAVALYVGFALRVFYFAYTDFDTRAYDWDGHLEYMRYVADHWVIPVGNAGWEFHQQPLYYFIGAVLLAAMRFANVQDAFIPAMQWISLLFSLATLGFCGWISTMLFPTSSPRSALQRGVFLGLLAALPGIVMFTSRVNNDVPTLFFAVATIASLLHWWKRGTFESWLVTVSFLSLALLTKSSSLPLCAAVGALCVLRNDRWPVLLRNIAAFALLVGIVLGGTYLVRVVFQSQGELVPVWVTKGLRVKNFAAAYYTFNPWEVLQHPFNHNWIDEHRRQYFWEYLLRSAFFGEWDFGYFRTAAVTILASSMLLIPVWVAGFIRSLWTRKPVDLAFGLLLAVSMAALLTFRFMHPNSSNQELRYIMYAVVPFAYFLARGVALVRYRLPFVFLAAVMLVTSGIFIVFAAYHSR